MTLLSAATVAGSAALTPWRRHTLLAAAVLAAICVAFASGLQLSVNGQLAVLGAALAVFGLPHGALDIVDGPKLAPAWLGRWRTPAYLLTYLTVAGLVLVGWTAAPTLTLLAFLAVSVLHFGAEDAHPDERPPAVEVIARGALPVIAPLLFHGEETLQIFDWLTSDPAVARVGAAAVPAAGVLWVALLLLTVKRRLVPGPNRDLLVVLELALLAALFAAAPPLVAFTAYFCILHAPRHLLREAGPLRPALAPAALAALAAGGIWFWLSATRPPEVAGVQAVFWALSALTAPHMLQAALTRRRPRFPRLSKDGAEPRKAPSRSRTRSSSG